MHCLCERPSSSTVVKALDCVSQSLPFWRISEVACTVLCIRVYETRTTQLPVALIHAKYINRFFATCC
jgi:hypothetical protein